MGGHAFPRLYCPRMSPNLYFKVRQYTTEALRTLFKHVVVPTELPSKTDYGDVDFLVSGFLLRPSDAELDWQTMVSQVKEAFQTNQGKHGYLNPNVMYFAIPAPGPENNFWVQVDVKVCQTPGKLQFDWSRFCLNYASCSKMIGSMLKPLGLRVNPEGLHLVVEEMETTNLPGAMVFAGKNPLDLLKIMGLDKRILSSGFSDNEEIYQYLASSWLFNPKHFQARLEDDKYVTHLEEKCKPWVPFVERWIPEHYPNYQFPHEMPALHDWYRSKRAAVRENVFTLFPAVATEYYTKRRVHLKEVEERRLQALLMKAIPVDRDGWRDNFPHPPTVAKPTPLETSPLQSIDTDYNIPKPVSSSNKFIEKPPTPPPSPPPSPSESKAETRLEEINPLDTLLYLHSLPRAPPIPFTARPPSASMSVEARLSCLARWTQFDPDTSAPSLAHEPREKKFEMCWSDSGASDEMLKGWAKNMWWTIWVRQSRINYVGMWKKRFEKEDAKKAGAGAKETQGAGAKAGSSDLKGEKLGAAKGATAAKENEEKGDRERILGRLRALNAATVAL